MYICIYKCIYTYIYTYIYIHIDNVYLDICECALVDER